jgi:hypothetical protein
MHRNMKKHEAVAALTALSQESRLDAFRLLVEAGPQRLPGRTRCGNARRPAKHSNVSFRSPALGRACHGATERALDDLFRPL